MQARSSAQMNSQFSPARDCMWIFLGFGTAEAHTSYGLSWCTGVMQRLVPWRLERLCDAPLWDDAAETYDPPKSPSAPADFVSDPECAICGNDEVRSHNAGVQCQPTSVERHFDKLGKGRQAGVMWGILSHGRRATRFERRESASGGEIYAISMGYSAIANPHRSADESLGLI